MLRKHKHLVGFLLLGLLLAIGMIFSMSDFLRASGKAGQLELVGVSLDVIGGRYDTKTGIFFADLSKVPEAYVKITFDDVVVTAKIVEWNTKTEYLKAQEQVAMIKEKLDLTGDELEYFTAEERLEARGNVKVISNDATLFSEEMSYLEAEDKATFLKSVVVEITDGIFRGEHFVLYIEEEQMEFFGPFQGEFVQKED